MVQFDLGVFSKRRTHIMGFAMLCVVYFHSGFDLRAISPIQLLKQWGDIGVDIFLMMSGMGIYHSLNRKQDVSLYIRGRLRRIVPAHLLVCGVWFFFLDVILYREGFMTFLMDVTSVNFWVYGRLTTWYLSALLLMQLLTPAFLQLWKKHPSVGLLAIPVVQLMCLTVTYTPVLNQSLDHLLIFFYRIPAYLAGLCIGRRICENRAIITISTPLTILTLVVSVGVLVISSGLTPLYLRWVLRYMVYLPIAIILCAIVVQIPENRLFTYFGTHSLEIYLLHEKILWVLSILAGRIIGEGMIQTIAVNILAILLTCVGAAILRNIFARICKKGVKKFA